jgi:hypothetical protein
MFSNATFDRMDQDRMDQLTPTKKEDKERRRGPNREHHKGETK